MTVRKLPNALTQRSAKPSTKKVGTKAAKRAVVVKVSTTKDKLDSKLDTIARLHQKNKDAKLSIDDHTLVPSPAERMLSLRPKFELALLSPYRLNLDSQKVAVSVARFGGVLFMLLGAVSTLFFASELSLGSSSLTLQSATVLGTQTIDIQKIASTTTQSSINCSDELQYGSPTCAATVDKTPDATFELVGNRDSVLGSVRVAVRVPYAKSIALFSVSKDTNYSQKIDLMSKVSDGLWEQYVDTTHMHDGNYRLRALISNAYGTYEVQDPALFTIENAPLDDTHATQAATSTEDTDVPHTAVTEASLSLVSQSPEEIRFSIVATDADSVKLYAKQVVNDKQMLLGQAYKESNTLWRYRWGVSDLADGSYIVSAQVSNDGILEQTNNLKVEKSKVSAVSVATTSTPQVVDIKPKPSISLIGKDPVHDSFGIKVVVPDALSVEVFSRREGELTKKLLGTAKKIDIDTYALHLDSNVLPNAQYTAVLRIQNKFGFYESEALRFGVKNSTTELKEVQTESIEKLRLLAEEVEQAERSASGTTTALTKTEENEQGEDVTTQAANRPDVVVPTLDESDALFKMLVAAKRLGDQAQIDAIAAKLDAAHGGDADKKAKFEGYIAEAKKEAQTRVERSNRIIAERTGDKVTIDSDKDGISDFDEVALFKTNPYLADSDADGFADDAEILGGYNPLDAKNESEIAYESPKEAGVVRKEMFAVSSVVAAEREESEHLPAIISGKGLPNSFVTLYIFSTPIVVTVKTEPDGSFAYRFDSELENGEHEVYVGVTDNAGKIVAKSEPFRFVKEAAAFTGSTSDKTKVAPAPFVPPVTSFMSEYLIYLVLSISVVAIGLVLILLGLYLDTRSKSVQKLVSEPAVT